MKRCGGAPRFRQGRSFVHGDRHEQTKARRAFGGGPYGRDFGCVGWLARVPRQCQSASRQDAERQDADANAAAQSGDALTLSEAQRKMAWQDLYMDSLNQNTPPGFDAVVGTTVPNTIVIAPVTAQAGSDVPALKPYSFAMVQKKLVIVNPGNRKIANVIAQ
jgi:Protein of unknown function (DUF1236)